MTTPPAQITTVTSATRTAGLRDRIVALINDRRVRYLAVGGGAVVLFYAIFATIWFVTGGRAPYMLVTVVTNLLTAISTYPVQAKLVWRAPLSVVGFLRFYALWLLSLAWSFVGLPLMIEVMHLPVLIAVPIFMALVPLLNYQLMKVWAFRHRRAR